MNTAKTAVINNEISAIKNAAILWVGQHSSDGTYAGIKHVISIICRN